MRIQKSLILDFDEESAQDSAIEDWKIDIEREIFEKKNDSNINKNDTMKNPLPSINEEEEGIKQDEP